MLPSCPTLSLVKASCRIGLLSLHPNLPDLRESITVRYLVTCKLPPRPHPIHALDDVEQVPAQACLAFDIKRVYRCSCHATSAAS